MVTTTAISPTAMSVIKRPAPPQHRSILTFESRMVAVWRAVLKGSADTLGTHSTRHDRTSPSPNHDRTNRPPDHLTVRGEDYLYSVKAPAPPARSAPLTGPRAAGGAGAPSSRTPPAVHSGTRNERPTRVPSQSPSPTAPPQSQTDRAAGSTSRWSTGSSGERGARPGRRSTCHHQSRRDGHHEQTDRHDREQVEGSQQRRKPPRERHRSMPSAHR